MTYGIGCTYPLLRDTRSIGLRLREEVIKFPLIRQGAEGRGAVLWPLRYSLTGLEKSPDPFEVAHLIGKEASLRRIDAALAMLAI